MQNDFYVYRHIRLDTNTLFYVGKGKGNRAFIERTRNQYWKRISKKCGYLVEFILENLNESDSFKKEIEFIKMYKELGYCEANLASGGLGTSGIKKDLSGIKNPMYGKNHREEARNKISKSKVGKKMSDKSRENISLGKSGDKHYSWIKRLKINEDIYKKCTKCKEYRITSLFCKDSSRFDGLSYKCKLCSNIRESKVV